MEWEGWELWDCVASGMENVAGLQPLTVDRFAFLGLRFASAQAVICRAFSPWMFEKAKSRKWNSRGRWKTGRGDFED